MFKNGVIGSDALGNDIVLRHLNGLDFNPIKENNASKSSGSIIRTRRRCSTFPAQGLNKIIQIAFPKQFKTILLQFAPFGGYGLPGGLTGYSKLVLADVRLALQVHEYVIYCLIDDSMALNFQNRTIKLIAIGQSKLQEISFPVQNNPLGYLPYGSLVFPVSKYSEPIPKLASFLSWIAPKPKISVPVTDNPAKASCTRASRRCQSV